MKNYQISVCYAEVYELKMAVFHVASVVIYNYLSDKKEFMAEHLR